MKYDLNALKKLGQGECAEIFELDDVTVLKLAREGWTREDLYEEYRSGKVIGDSVIPAPKVYDFVEQDGRFGFTMWRDPGWSQEHFPRNREIPTRY